MLIGKLPFVGISMVELKSAIRNGLDSDLEALSNLPIAAKDLI